MKVNLHMHSMHSDGDLDVHYLVHTMLANDFDIIAITDHDTTSGYEEAMLIPDIDRFVKIIPGIEFSARNQHDIKELPEQYSFHILGYGFDVDKLRQKKDEIRHQQAVMAQHLMKKLTDKGYKINITDQQPANLHDIAHMLFKAGYVSDVDDAFEKIINKHDDVHSHDPYTVKNVIEILHECGGVAIWAHPFDLLLGSEKIRLDRTELESILKQLVDFGIDGIEASYVKYAVEDLRYLLELADHHKIYTSSGSDFHGKHSDEWLLLNHEYLSKTLNDPLIKRLLHI